MDNKEFTLELSDTKLRPYTLLELMREFGYGDDDAEFSDSGWELNFWIYITKDGYYPSTSEKLCICGCGMTFELKLKLVREFM